MTSADVLRSLLAQLHLPHEHLVPIEGSKTDVFLIEDAGLVAKVSSIYADCIEHEARNLELLLPHTRRVVQTPVALKPLHHVEDWAVLFTMKVQSIGPVAESELPEALAQFLDDIATARGPFPSWKQQHELAISRLSQLPDDCRQPLQEVLDSAVNPLLSRDWPLVPIHGDAYADNAIKTNDGIVWVDLEDVQVAPRALAFSLLETESVPGVINHDFALFKMYRAWTYAIWKQPINGVPDQNAIAALGRLEKALQKL